MSSLANYITSTGTLAFQSEISSSESMTTLHLSNGVNSYTHYIDSNGKLTIQNDAIPSTPLLAFASDCTLAPCQVKTYTDAVQNTVIAQSNLLSTQSSQLASLQGTVTSLQSGGGGLGGAEDVTFSGLLSSSGDGGGSSITNVNNVSCDTVTVSGNITSTGGSQLLGFANLPTVVTGTLTYDAFTTLTSCTITSGVTTYVNGSVATSHSFCNFRVLINWTSERFVGEVATISNWTYDGYLQNGESMQFSMSSHILQIQYYSTVGGAAYNLSYIITPM